MASWINDLKSGNVSKSTSCASTAISGGAGNPVAWGYYHLIDYTGTVGVATENFVKVPPNWSIGATVGGIGANAYLLPWGANKICYSRLNAAHDLFFTAAMNGCGVMIAGARATPLVVHANAYDHHTISGLAGMEKAEKRQEIYAGFVDYLQGQHIIQNDNVATWYPGSDYAGAKSGVFGARKAGGWVFYGHANQGNKATTQVIWPLDAVDDGGDSGCSKCCFITTAVCQSLGLPDDCPELQALRWYRDEVLAQTESGRRDIDTYYRIAPRIVAQINQREDPAGLYRDLHRNSISPAVTAIRAGDMQRAYDVYLKMLRDLTGED